MDRRSAFLGQAVLMLTWMVVLFLPVSCEDSSFYEEGEWDEQSIIKTKSGCEDKCSPSCKCNWLEVGCEDDSDCSSGLRCEIRPQLGNRCLKKKDGDAQSDSGDGGCHEFKPGHGSYCSDTCKCKAGEGDCDKDSHCMSGLVCEQQDGTDFCVSAGGGDGGDCHEFKPGHGSYCSDTCKCKAGEGDCDKDSQCMSGLVCVQQDGTDFCEKPSGGGDDGDDSVTDNSSGNSTGELKVVVFSVGSGDASLIVFPTGKKMMIDSAADTKFKKVVLPFLQRHKVGHLDYYLQTHPHGDHKGGEALLKSSGYIDSKTKQWDWNTYDYGDQFQIEGTKWFISNARDTSYHGSDTNYNSVSYRIEYNGFVYSGAGDEGTKAQNRYLSGHRNLVKAHVRNTAHHMWGPVSQSYLVATDPYLFIISSSSDVKQDSAFRNTFLGAVSTLKKSGRLKEYGLTADVGHVIVRASSGSKWSYDFCSNVSTCTVPGLL